MKGDIVKIKISRLLHLLPGDESCFSYLDQVAGWYHFIEGVEAFKILNMEFYTCNVDHFVEMNL
jgi:hypothetical protein